MSQSQLSKESAAMLAAFRKQPGVTDTHYRNLINIVASSPLLTERFNLAVANKHISGLSSYTFKIIFSDSLYPTEAV